MVDADKKQFWQMVNITMELCNRPPLSKEAIVGYWQMLNKYDIDTVRAALDTWVDSSDKAPTPHAIKELCKPKDEVYKSLPRPNSREANKQYAENVVNFVQENTKKSGRNWIKFWEDKLNNPKGQSEIVLRFAKDALKQLGKEWHGNNSDSQATSNNLAINSHK